MKRTHTHGAIRDKKGDALIALAATQSNLHDFVAAKEEAARQERQRRRKKRVSKWCSAPTVVPFCANLLHLVAAHVVHRKDI